MHIEEAFAVDGLEAARELVRRHPFATIVTPDLRATHMPCLVDDDADGLVVLGHVAKPDPVSAGLPGELLLVFHGPHGYVSASWYGEGAQIIPTWDHLTLHVRGRAEVVEDTLSVLRRTVDHFEAAVEDPWSLDRMDDGGAEMAGQVVAFRLEARSWHAEAKAHQDKDDELRERVVTGLEAPGPYRNPALAALVRGR